MGKAKDFIGKTFTTPKGGVLTVVSKLPQEPYTTGRYEIHCSICSEDQELWRDLSSIRTALVKGQSPCGCSKVLVLPEWRWEVIIGRECVKRDYTFNGWVGDFKGVGTKLNLINNKTGKKWASNTITRFMIGYGDGCHGEDAITKSNERFVQRFLSTGSYIKGTLFTKNINKRGKHGFWDVYCPICSEDIYVENGLCDGVFTTTGSSLSLGCNPCRCSPNYTFTKAQQELRIKEVMRGEWKGTFNGWVSDYVNSNTKFRWVCDGEHSVETSVVKFMQGDRCLYCHYENNHNNKFGLYFDRCLEEDNLYVYKIDDKYLKIGRSFDVRKRESGLRYASKSKNLELLFTVTDKHENIYALEQEIHKNLRSVYLGYKTGWSTETFSLEALPLVREILQTYLSFKTYPT